MDKSSIPDHLTSAFERSAHRRLALIAALELVP
jgi:hypothetical protein